MSSDIQDAAAFFGCDALLHVIDSPGKSGPTFKWPMEKFIRPLPAVVFRRMSGRKIGKIDSMSIFL